MKQLRKEIDKIDSQIVKLLDKRIKLSKQIGEYKKKNNLKITDSKREKEVLKNVKKKSKNSAFVLKLYKLIIRESKRKQN